MRLVVAGIGRMKAGPERDLLERYSDRARALCRTAGITSFDLVEMEESRARSAETRKREEASGLAGKLPPGTHLVALDERGRSITSEDFARLIGQTRDRAVPAFAVAVGGPDGLDADFVKAAATRLAFGAATLPHQLVRILAAEQLYRALTILTGHPYHRG